MAVNVSKPNCIEFNTREKKGDKYIEILSDANEPDNNDPNLFQTNNFVLDTQI